MGWCCGSNKQESRGFDNIIQTHEKKLSYFKE